MFARRAHSQAETRAVEQPTHHRDGDDAEPNERIAPQGAQTGSRLLAAESRHPRRVRRTMEREPKEKPCGAGDEQVDRDANYHLVRPEENGRHRIEKCQDCPAANRAEQPEPRATAVVAGEGAAERAAEHVPLQPEANEAPSLRDYAAARGEQIRDRDPQRLREERQHDHAELRASRRTSGTDAATAMITTA